MTLFFNRAKWYFNVKRGQIIIIIIIIKKKKLKDRESQERTRYDLILYIIIEKTCCERYEIYF